MRQELPDGWPQLTAHLALGYIRHVDVRDKQGDGDGEDGIAERHDAPDGDALIPRTRLMCAGAHNRWFDPSGS